MSPTAGRTFATLGLLAVVGCRTGNARPFAARAGGPAANVVVLDNHWHTALIFRTTDLPEAFLAQLGDFGRSRYVAIGWGDEGFFRADHITPGLVAQALFYSRGSVLLVIAFDAEPEAAFRPDVGIYRVPVADETLHRVVAAALSAFRRDADGRIVDAGPGIDGGRFYAALGRYAWHHTCNQWTADCLATAGLPVSGVFAGTAAGVETQLRGLPGVRRNGEPVPPWRPSEATARSLARGPHP